MTLWLLDTGAAARDASIGVVIPVFNRRTLLLETLARVAAQTRLPERLVVVDDGSTDGTADAAEAWLAERKPPLVWSVIRRPHENAAAARCVGFAALGPVDLVAFVDSDDHWPADFLSRTAAALTGDPDAAAVSVDRRYVDATGVKRKEDDCRPLAGDPIGWFFRRGAGIASCTLLRRAAYERAGGWNPRRVLGEDSELFAMIALEGRWRHTPGGPVTFHLGNAPGRGEASNLSRQYADHQFRWARAYEAIFDRVTARRPWIDRGPLRAALADRWCAAGRQMRRLGRQRAAEACFARSLAWNPAQLTGWGRLATARFPRRAA